MSEVRYEILRLNNNVTCRWRLESMNRNVPIVQEVTGAGAGAGEYTSIFVCEADLEILMLSVS